MVSPASAESSAMIDPNRKKAPKAKTPLPPFEEFVAEAQRLKDQAMRVLQADGSHTPILVLFTERGMEIGGIQTSGDRAMHEYVKAIVKARGAQAFVCISESWMVMNLSGVATNVRPSLHPDRRECLVVSAVHPSGSRMWATPFSREHNTITFGATLDSSAMGMDLRGGIPEALDREE